MSQLLYTFSSVPNWDLMGLVSEIDRFDATWTSIENREGKSLKQLKAVATVRSIGASTRIEGSRISDDEVKALIDKIDVSKLEDRDSQEVVGYWEALDIITNSYEDIEINENSIKHIHRLLLKYSDKDEWHRGDYKQHSNVVEATEKDGRKYVVFQPTEPGYATEDAMRNLLSWYHTDKKTLPIIRSAVFAYEFLSIHPFQDGNGRLSRLITTLLLLKNGYTWAQYMSFEHEIENRKQEYYHVLMTCQKQRPGEDIYPWLIFFLDCLNNIKGLLLNKLKETGVTAHLTHKENLVYRFIDSHPKTRSGEISENLNIPLPTIKKLLAEMVEKKLIFKHGVGKGTYYTIE